MARCRWLAGTATVAAGMAALATVAAGQPRRVLEGPPGVPSLWFKTVTESLSVYRVPGMEVPALARIVSSFMNLAFECTGTYDSSGVVYTDAFGQPLPAVADEADRTDVNVDLCAAAAVIGVKRRYFGDAVAEKMHAAGVKEGVDLPRTLDDCPDASVASPACYGLTLLERLVANHLDVDGYNELGTDGRRRGDRSPPAPYKDVVTGYKPVNKPGRVRHLTRWVPLVEDLWGWGTYVRQTVTHPQASQAKPVLLPAAVLARATSAPPYRHADAYAPNFRCGSRRGRSPAADPDGLCKKAVVVRDAVKAATMEQKTIATWFDVKIGSLSTFPVLNGLNLTLPQYFTMEYTVNNLLYDTMTLVWREKLRADAVRPATLVPSILDPSFAPHVRTMPHSEYPSASACFCRVFLDALRVFGGDEVSLGNKFYKGDFGRDLPSRDFTVSFKDTDEMARVCGQSRVWAGLHFQDAVDEGARLCSGLAKEGLKVAGCRARGSRRLPKCRT